MIAGELAGLTRVYTYAQLWSPVVGIDPPATRVEVGATLGTEGPAVVTSLCPVLSPVAVAPPR